MILVTISEDSGQRIYLFITSFAKQENQTQDNRTCLVLKNKYTRRYYPQPYTQQPLCVELRILRTMNNYEIILISTLDTSFFALVDAQVHGKTEDVKITT